MSFDPQKELMDKSNALRRKGLGDLLEGRDHLEGRSFASIQYPQQPQCQEKNRKLFRFSYTPEIQHRYQQLPCLKGVTFSKQSFWVSMLVFGDVGFFKTKLSLWRHCGDWDLG